MIENAMLCLKALKNYTGLKMIFLLSMAVWFYLFFREKNKNIRVAFALMPLAVMLLFICPVTYSLYGLLGLDIDTYYRILWIIPIGMVTIYGVVKFISKKRWTRIAGAVITTVFIALTGEYVFSSTSFVTSENIYGIPQQTIDIVDFIKAADEHETICVLPSADLITTIRQYDANIRIPYGRDFYAMYAKGITYDVPLFYEYDLTERLNFKRLLEASEGYDIEYIVVHKARLFDDDPIEAGLEYLGEVDDHLIYRNTVIAEKMALY